MRTRVRSVTSCAVLVLGVASGPRGAAAAWTPVTPSAYTQAAKLSVDGVETTCYRFDWERPLAFSVDGPACAKILTRLVIPNDRERDSYTLTIALDGVTVEEETLDTAVSGRAFYLALDGVRPGLIRRTSVDVAPGSHTVEIQTSPFARVDGEVYVSGDVPPEGGDVSPCGREEAWTLLAGDSETAYRIVMNDTPVMLEAVGPATIEVSTRLISESVIPERQRYTIGVREVDATEVLYEMERAPSTSGVCPSWDEAAPGDMGPCVLSVEPGLHAFELRMGDAGAEALVIRFRIARASPDGGP